MQLSVSQCESSCNKIKIYIWQRTENKHVLGMKYGLRLENKKHKMKTFAGWNIEPWILYVFQGRRQNKLLKGS